MKIDVYQCFSKNIFPFNIVALLIRFFQGTNYSHYAISFEINGVRFFMDSTSKSVRLLGEEQFLKHYELKKCLNYKHKEIDEAEFLAWMQSHLGKSYGFGQIIGLLLKIFKIIKNNPFGKGSKRIICNELIVLFFIKFHGAQVIDTDSLDLNETEELVWSYV